MSKQSRKSSKSERNSHTSLADFNRHSRLKPLAAAVVCACTAGMPAQLVMAQSDGATMIEEVLVTAQRREQKIQDIPYNISAYTSKDLSNARASSLSDIVRMIPGLAYVDQGNAPISPRNTFILRGINATDGSLVTRGDISAAPVSMYFGETPLFATLIMKDIERVEVLRGPQGTLYGSGSLGGTVRFLPNKPNLKELSGQFNTNLDSTWNSDELSYGVDGMINIPLIEDKLALRVVATWEDLGGYIDGKAFATLGANDIPIESVPGDPTSGYVLFDEDDTNNEDSRMIRASLLWEPTDKFSVQLSYTNQKSQADDISAANPGFDGGFVDNSLLNFPGSLFSNGNGCTGGLVMFYVPCNGPGGNTLFPDGGVTYPSIGKYEHSFLLKQPRQNKLELFNAEVSVDVGFATLSSSTSYMDQKLNSVVDLTGFVLPTRSPGAASFASYYGFYPRVTSPTDTSDRNKRFVEELRIVSNWDNDKFDFVAGFYYEDLDSRSTVNALTPGVSAYDATINPGVFFFNFGKNNLNLPDLSFTEDREFQFEDKAVYGELTWHVSDKWQMTGGIRAFWQQFDHEFLTTTPYCGFYCGGDPADPAFLLGGTTVPLVTQNFSDQVFKFNTSYDFNDDLKAYFTWAEGFRHGGANALPLGGRLANLPSFLTYEPDKATNWEFGLKGTLWNKVRYSMAGYYIDWDNFQFEAFTASAFAAVLNGEKARSLGFELEANGDITDHLSFNFGYSYVDAEVTRDFTIQDLSNGAGSPLADSIAVSDGDKLPNVPKHTLTAGVDFVQPFGSNGWTLAYHTDVNYRSKTNSVLNEGINFGRDWFEVDAFAIWNASLTLRTNDAWNLSVYLRNIGNEDGLTGGQPAGRNGATHKWLATHRPRTVGIGFSYDYN